MKKVFLVLMSCIFAISLIGCGSDEKASSSVKADNKEEASSGRNISYLDYIHKVEVGDSLDKLNEVLGSEGKVRSDDATYTWDLENGGFTAIFKAGDQSSAIKLQVSYENEDVENKEVKIKDLEDLQSKVSEGIDYEQFKEFMGGVDGILVAKGPVTNDYVWRSPNGSVVDAGFTVDDKKCNSFVGSEK